MRFYFLIVLLIGMLYIIVGHALLRKPLPKIGITLLALIILPTAFFEIRWQIMEHQGTQIVQAVSGNPAGHLHCERFSEALVDPNADAGEVRYANPNEAYLRYKYCQDFMSLLYGDKQHPTAAQTLALHVLDHESIHVSGDYDEADTECKAIAIDPQTAEKIGIPANVAEKMQQQYMKNVYPYLASQYHKTC